MSIRFVFWAALVLALVSLASSAAEPAEPPTDDQIPKLIKDLGSDQFDVRQRAEVQLKLAGVRTKAALEAAKESTDPQIKVTAARLLEQLRWATLGPVDYLQVLPKKVLFAVKLAPYPLIVKHFENTAFGKLIYSPPLAALRAKAQDAYDQTKPNRTELDYILEHFTGQATAAVWEFNIMAGPGGIKAGLIAEVADPDPRAFFNEFLDRFPMITGNTVPYKGVAVLEGPGGGAVGMVGKNFIIASNAEAAHELIDNFEKPGGLALSDDFTKAKSGMVENPDVVLCIDMQKYFGVLGMFPGMGPFGDFSKQTGADALRMFIVSIGPVGAGYQENYTLTTEGELKGLMALGNDIPERPPLAALAQVPATALAAGVGYLDGNRVQPAVEAYIKSLKEMLAGLPGAGAAPFGNVEQGLDALEKAMGLTVSDVVTSMKGECVTWAAASPTAVNGVPDLGLFVTCVDAAHAKTVCDAAVKAVKTLSPKQIVQEQTVGGNTVYVLDLAALAVPVPPEVPYSPCWTVSANRIYLTSSVAALRRQLDCVAGTVPGLLTEANFVKTLTQLPEAERKNGLIYVDVARVLTIAADAAQKHLTPMIPDPQLGAAVAALGAPKDFFKDLPALIMGKTAQNGVQTTTIRGPFPMLPTLLGVGAGAGFLVGRSAARRAPVRLPPVAPVPNPNDF